MIRSGYEAGSAGTCIPRESGDDPDVTEHQGWADVVFPARAGMIRRESRLQTTPRRIPRESGDDPNSTLLTPTPVAYSPRERG